MSRDQEHKTLHFDALNHDRENEGPVSDFGQNVFHAHGLSPSPRTMTKASRRAAARMAEGGSVGYFVPDTSPITKWEAEFTRLCDRGRTAPDGFTPAHRYLLSELERAEAEGRLEEHILLPQSSSDPLWGAQ